MKPYMYSGATITYLGLSNNWNELDDEENQVCRTIFNEIIIILQGRRKILRWVGEIVSFLQLINMRSP